MAQRRLSALGLAVARRIGLRAADSGDTARRTTTGRFSFMRRKVVPIAALSLAAVGGLATAYYTTRDTSGSLANRIDRKLAGVVDRLDRSFNGRHRVFDAPIEINTGLLKLVGTKVSVDTARPTFDPNPLSFTGGGLTSFGADVLVLAYNGRIYAASDVTTVRETKIAAPDKHQAAYEAAADSPKYKGYTFYKSYLRYNDILFFDSGTTRALLASYTEYQPDRDCYTNTIAKLPIARSVTSIDAVSAGASDWTVVYRTSPCLPFKKRYLALEGQIAGGRLAIAGPDAVYLTSGDFHHDGLRSDDKEPLAQKPHADYGKVLKVDLTTGTGEMVSFGHRNPQGIAVTSNGDVYATEHGPSGGDELNKIVAGANYGWPLESLGTSYAFAQIPGSRSFGHHTNFTPPAFAWMPSPALSSLTALTAFNPAWDGDLIAGSLATQALYRIRLEKGRALYAEEIPIGERIRATHQHTGGQLVLWTDAHNLIFLKGEKRKAWTDDVAAFADAAKLGPDRTTTLTETLTRCAECHNLRDPEHKRAPGLARIWGSPIARTPFAGYSAALAGTGGVWSAQNLQAFIQNPQAFAPGTSMPATEIDDAELANTIVQYLAFIDEQF